MITHIRDNALPNLSTDQRGIWDEFFSKQDARAPEKIKSLKNQKLLDEIYEKSRAKHYDQSSPRLKQLFDSEEYKNRLHLMTKVKALESKLPKAMSALAKRGLYFAKISGSKSFIIGSQPLVRLANGGTTALDDPKTELWYPIAHDIAVSIGSYEEKEKLFILTNENTKLIRQINLEIVNQSNEIAGKSAKLISSLIKNKTTA